MTRWTVYLRETTKGWDWGRAPGQYSWGSYLTLGRAKVAARRRILGVIGAKANPADFKFIIENRVSKENASAD
jgi:hypothetical protein